MIRISLAVIAAATSLSACSIREARIAMPSDSATEQLELTGMGGGTAGEFRLADGAGRFTRGAERLGIFDPLLVRHRGGGSFRFASPTMPEIASRCSYREGTVSVGPISVTPRRLAFHCEFARNGRPIDAALILHDPQGPLGTLHGRDEREGVLFYDGRQIAVRSIHHDQAGGLPSPTALGYAFVADGRQIGAIDLNGPNKTIFAPLGGPEREAVIAASIALSTFWDPAAL